MVARVLYPTLDTDNFHREECLVLLIVLVAASAVALAVHLFLFMHKQRKRQVGLILVVPTVILIVLELIFNLSILFHVLVIGTAVFVFAAAMTRGTRRAPMFRRYLLAFWCFMIGLFIIAPLAVHPTTPAPANPGPAVAAPKLSDDAIRALTVDEGMLANKDVPRCKTEKFKYDIPSSRKFTKENGRTTADAISTPLELGDDARSTINNLRAKVCTDPVLGTSIIIFLLRQDPRIAQVNPWTKRFVDPDSTKDLNTRVNTVAAYFYKHQNDPTPSSNQKKEMRKLEEEWREVANVINVLLGYTVDHKVSEETPLSGFHVIGSLRPVSGLRAVGDDDKLTSEQTFRLNFPRPNGKGCEFALGIVVDNTNPVRLPCS